MAKDDKNPPEVAASAEDQPKRYDPKAATPEEHARAAGQVTREQREPVTFNGEDPGPAYTWQHAAAAQLHGWNHHKLHDATPLTITREAYEAALKAVEAPVVHAVDAKTGKRRVLGKNDKASADESLVHDYVAHGPAVSKHFAPKE